MTLRLLGLSTAMAALAFAQGDRGTISGLITDASGGVVPGVAIEAIHVATSAKFETVTTSTGAYRLVNLPIGIYNLTAKAQGFQTAARQNIQIQVNQTASIDITMAVGDVTQTVSVQGEVPLIQTENSDVGVVVESKQFLDLPLTLGGGIRNPSNFIKLSPGVDPRSTWTKSISGGGAFQDMTYYDGIALSRGDLSNDAEVNPSVDAIAEFKLITNNYSAEYSHALGGITSFTMKSGTNQVHGTAFHFIRNEKLDARGFFPAVRSPFKQNEFGGTVGGPINLPKIYDGRNRTFFFYSVDQSIRRGGPLAGLNTLPTARMQTGDFAELPRTIFDPATNATAANGQVSRMPFAGGRIPQSRWSRVSQVMLPFHPKPELPGFANNSIAPLGSPTADELTQGFKIDHMFNSNHRISGVFNATHRPSTKSPGPSRLIPVGDTTALANYNDQVVTTRVIHVNIDSNLTPTTLNHIGLGFSRFRNPNFSQSFQKGWLQPNGGKLGLRGLQYDLFPTVLFDTEGYTRYGDDIASDNYFNTFTVLDTATLIRGNHTIKFGGEVQSHQDNYRNFGNGGGTFRFRRESTGQPGVANSGDAWASFLLGEVFAGTGFFRSSIPGGRYRIGGLFVDDTWRLTSRLTLNLGFRWEMVVPHSDPLGRISYADIGKPNPGAGNLPGVMVYGGPQGFGNRYLEILKWNPAPRIGFAYRVTNRTVVRAGAGIFNSNYINQGLGLPAFGFSTTAAFDTADNGITPAFNWDGGFPQNFRRPPITDPTAANGQNVNTLFRDQYRLPYKTQWNFTIEHQLANDLAASVSYVANKGTNLYEGQQLNQLPKQYWGVDPAVLRSNINSPAARAAGYREPFPGFATLWGGRATVNQALRPFPQFNNVSVYGSTYGNSSYHSFQAKLDKRYGRGLSGTFAYTWSKFLTDAAVFDGLPGKQDELLRERAFHLSDLPHIVSMSFMYELPFGKGQKWLAAGPASRLLGGWQIAVVNAYNSGNRLAPSINNTLPFFNAGLRPNLLSGNLRSNVSMGNFDPARDFYLNREAFGTPAAGQLGTAPRYLHVRGPARRDESFAAIKNTRIKEGLTAQFRLEISNPLNRVVFGDPVTNVAANNFGRIGSTQIGPRNVQFGLKLLW
ncbi:MAG: carboxypeptidase regulatory-like domain-containing protein [Acidobacteria bacterium]|nr:carboxypeptidase regulatory-like domain-containing protein [Acidobacteriota bacterium]